MEGSASCKKHKMCSSGFQERFSIEVRISPNYSLFPTGCYHPILLLCDVQTGVWVLFDLLRTGWERRGDCGSESGGTISFPSAPSLTCTLLPIPGQAFRPSRPGAPAARTAFLNVPIQGLKQSKASVQAKAQPHHFWRLPGRC